MCTRIVFIASYRKLLNIQLLSDSSTYFYIKHYAINKSNENILTAFDDSEIIIIEKVYARSEFDLKIEKTLAICIILRQYFDTNG